MTGTSPPLIDLVADDDVVQIEVEPDLQAEMQVGNASDPPQAGSTSNPLQTVSTSNPLQPGNSGGSGDTLQVTAYDNGRHVTISAPHDNIGEAVLNVLNAANADQVLSPADPQAPAHLGGAHGPPPLPPTATLVPASLRPSGAPSTSNHPSGATLEVTNGPLPAVQLVRHNDSDKVYVNLALSGHQVQQSLTRAIIYALDFNLGEVKRKFNFHIPCHNYNVGKCDNPNFGHTSANRPNGRWYSHICMVCWVRAKLPFHHNLSTCPFVVTSLDNTTSI